MLRKGKVSLCNDRFVPVLTLNLLTTTIVAPPSNDSKWQMGFNSAFKGLIYKTFVQTSGLIYKCFGSIMFRNIYLKGHERHVKTMVEYVSFTGTCGDKDNFKM